MRTRQKPNEIWHKECMARVGNLSLRTRTFPPQIKKSVKQLELAESQLGKDLAQFILAQQNILESKLLKLTDIIKQRDDDIEPRLILAEVLYIMLTN